MSMGNMVHTCRRVEGLQHMLNMYYEAVESVPQTELQLLTPILKDLESSLDAGFQVLNWNSLGIADFTQQCRKAINEFNTRIGQVLKNKRDIEALVQSIAMADIVPDDDALHVPTLQVCFSPSITLHRCALVLAVFTYSCAFRNSMIPSNHRGSMWWTTLSRSIALFLSCSGRWKRWLQVPILESLPTWPLIISIGKDVCSTP